MGHEHLYPHLQERNETHRGPGRPPGRPLRPPSEGAFILSPAFGSLCAASQRCLAGPRPWAGPFTYVRRGERAPCLGGLVGITELSASVRLPRGPGPQ